MDNSQFLLLLYYYSIITINIIKRNVLYNLNKSTLKEILFYINNYIIVSSYCTNQPW